MDYSAINNSPEPLGRQTVQGTLYSALATGTTLILGFIRATLLARFLLPEHFGVLTFALFFLNLVAHLRGLGLDYALIHRQDENEDFRGTYFILRVGIDLAVFALVILCTPWLQRAYPQMPDLEEILPVLMIGFLLANLSLVQETLMRKRLRFKSLGLINVSASLVMLLVAPYLAWQGWGVWALVAERVSGLATRFLLSWSVFRQWRPRIRWNKEAARWLWQFGKPSWLATNLTLLIDRFDDFWIGTSLGGISLGLYSKAYEFALYPRRLFGNPLETVFTPVFSKLQNDRLHLSQAFFRSGYLILRTNFFVSGIFALVMPEFIHMVIGDKWLPMLWPFRLMLIYTMIDPFLMLINNLLIVTGRPDELRQIKLTQTIFFLPAVIIGAALGNIYGVALAADGMLLIGLLKALSSLRKTVDFSTSRLLLHPILILGLALGLGLWIEVQVNTTLWINLSLKVAAYIVLFIGWLALIERDDYLKGLKTLKAVLRPIRSNSTGSMLE